MPRIVFCSEEQLENWCKEFVDTGKYVIYLTEYNEVILEPLKSTRPLRFGYFKGLKGEKLATKLQELHQIPLFRVRDYEWDLEKSPGIKVAIE